MPHYMFTGRYGASAIKAMIQKPQDREAAARELADSMGGKLLSFYFTFGDDDMIAIFEAPDDTSAAAVSLVVGASGALSGGKTVRLMTTKEGIAAMEKARGATYHPADA